MKNNTLKVFCEDIARSGIIDNELFIKYDVKRGLRDLSGRGVLAGLTRISEVQGTEVRNGKIYPKEGDLRYRGIEINEIIEGFVNEESFLISWFRHYSYYSAGSFYRNIHGSVRSLNYISHSAIAAKQFCFLTYPVILHHASV